MIFKFGDDDEFVPGTRVMYIGGSKIAPLRRGEKGTVVTYGYGPNTVGVDWDLSHPSKHSCGGECHPDHGYVVKKEWIIKCGKE